MVNEPFKSADQMPKIKHDYVVQSPTPLGQRKPMQLPPPGPSHIVCRSPGLGNKCPETEEEFRNQGQISKAQLIVLLFILVGIFIAISSLFILGNYVTW